MAAPKVAHDKTLAESGLRTKYGVTIVSVKARGRTSPTPNPKPLHKELADHGLDAGADTVGWHLQQHHGVTVSRASINRYLTGAGLVVPDHESLPECL